MAEPKLTVEVEEKDVDIREADVINEEAETDEVEFEVNKDSVKEVEEPSEEPKSEAKEDELEDYSEGVKKRISQLTYKMREAERQREEAVKYAENVISENQKLKTSLKKLKFHHFSSHLSWDFLMFFFLSIYHPCLYNI